MRRAALSAGLLGLVVLVPAESAAGRPDTARWPANERMVLIQNDRDQSRPLDGRTGFSPFDHTAPASACSKRCRSYLVACEGEDCTPAGMMWDGRRRYLKLFGGHGNDSIHGGPFTDVLWGDFKPSGQPATQKDLIDGGAGRDFIYASHGKNTISGGAGDDYIVARFSRGSIDCGPGRDIVFVSKGSRKATEFTGCETITRDSLR